MIREVNEIWDRIVGRSFPDAQMLANELSNHRQRLVAELIGISDYADSERLKGQINQLDAIIFSIKSAIERKS